MIVTISRSKRIAAVFLVLLVVVALLALNLVPQRGVQAKLNRIREARLPVSALELNDWYTKVPREENRALVLIEAAGEMVRTPPEVEAVVDQEPSEERATVLREHLAKNAKTLALLHEAKRLPKSRYPVDMTQGFTMSLSHLANVKGLAHLLRYEALYKLQIKDVPGTFEAITAAFAVAESLRNEPVLISELVGIACLSITAGSLERALNEVTFSKEQLEKLLAFVAQAEASGLPAFNRAMIGERVAGVDCFNLSFQALDALGAMPGTPAAPKNLLKEIGFQAYRATGLRQRDLEQYLDAMQLYIDSSQQAFPAAYAETLRAGAVIQQRMSTGLGRLAIFSRMLLPALGKAIEKEAMLSARLRCLESALAIESFRLDHSGALPEGLEELSPEYLHTVPKDPYDGSELQYAKFPEKGYHVWSVQASNAKGRPAKGPAEVGIAVRQ